jgi:ribosomal protein S18 acetylase RimI-like enzyme
MGRQMMERFQVVPIGEDRRRWAMGLLEERWGSVKIVTRGKVHDASRLPGFVALKDGEPVGLTTYRIDGAACEMVSLDSLDEGEGIGTALLEMAKNAALDAGCRRLWLITTNDNLHAVRFYQKRGFHLVAVHRDAMEISRKIKPSIPPTGIDGIPIRDEIELEIRL